MLFNPMALHRKAWLSCALLTLGIKSLAEHFTSHASGEAK